MTINRYCLLLADSTYRLTALPDHLPNRFSLIHAAWLYSQYSPIRYYWNTNKQR